MKLSSVGLVKEWRFESETVEDSRTGVLGRALRLDGFTVQRSDDSIRFDGAELSISSWVALKSYPVSNAAFVNQQTYPSSGFYFGVDPKGRWYFAVSVLGQWHTVWADEALPKNRWLNVAAIYRGGELEVYLDGEIVGRSKVEAASGKTRFTSEQREPLLIGRDNHSPKIGNEFPTGILNGLIDELRIYERALSSEEVRSHYQLMKDGGLSAPDFRVGNKFESDIHRPRLHAMPPEAWTNEPHGLLKRGDEYHLFYQKNPSGPYWSKIHWGQMKSRDLVHWEEQSIALAPDGGWDQEGVWSGNAVEEGQDIVAIYTGVDGAKAGVGLARSNDDGRTWVKDTANPVIPQKPNGYDEIRDPYVWKEGSQWYMIIGAGRAGKGSTVLYKSLDMKSWEFLGPLVEGGADAVGVFWEMPVLLPTGDGRHFLFFTTVERGGPARSLYWIGRWENERFIPEFDQPKSLDLLTHLLSPTFAAGPDGRLRAIGIVAEARSSKRQAEAGWAHTYGFPRMLGICEENRTEVCQKPAPELESLRGPEFSLDSRSWSGELTEVSDAIKGRRLEMEISIRPETAKVIRFTVLSSPDHEEETMFELDMVGERLHFNRTRASQDGETTRDLKQAHIPLVANRPLKVQVFVDHSIVEVFINDRHAFSSRVYPTRLDSEGVRIESLGGVSHLLALRAWPLVGSAMSEEVP